MRPVLIIDDDLCFADTLAHMLQPNGYAAEIADTPERAVAALRRSPDGVSVPPVVLIEISEQTPDEAFAVQEGIEKVLQREGIRRSILLHGEGATVWPFVERAAARKFSTRVGLEDGKELPDGSVAEGNAALVAAAVRIYRRT